MLLAAIEHIHALFHGKNHIISQRQKMLVLLHACSCHIAKPGTDTLQIIH